MILGLLLAYTWPDRPSPGILQQHNKKFAYDYGSTPEVSRQAAAYEFSADSLLSIND